MEKHKVDFYNIPIVDYLLSIGEPLESVGHNYYQHKHHDSLKINQRKNYFVWNSRSSEKIHEVELFSICRSCIIYLYKKHSQN